MYHKAIDVHANVCRYVHHSIHTFCSYCAGKIAHRVCIHFKQLFMYLFVLNYELLCKIYFGIIYVHAHNLSLSQTRPSYSIVRHNFPPK